MSETDANVQVSHEVNGRTLSGMGASAEQLESVMERHAPEEPAPTGTVVAPTTEGGTPPPATEPAPTRGRQRFADLTKERDEAKALAETAKTEREALARERDELKARLERPAPEPSPETAPNPVKATFPTFEDWVGIKGNEESDWYVYQDARTDWHYEQRRAAERETESREAATRTARDAETAYAAEVVKFRTEAPDYDAVMSKVGPRDVSLVVQHAAMQVGPRAAYYLAQHPEELRELTADTLMPADTPGFAAAVATTKRYLARLVTAPAPVAAPAPRRVAPPAPYTPVNGGTPTTQTPSSELAGKSYDFDKSGYREKRAAERKASRR